MILLLVDLTPPCLKTLQILWKNNLDEFNWNNYIHPWITENGTFIRQSKYTKKLIKKFILEKGKAFGTPMSPSTGLNTDAPGNDVDEKMYRGIWLDYWCIYLQVVQTSCSVYASVLDFNKLLRNCTSLQ